MLVGLTFYGQDTYYKNYKVTNFIDFLKDGKNKYDYDTLTIKHKKRIKFLSKEKCLNYYDLPEEHKNKIDKRLSLVKDSILSEVTVKDCSGNSLKFNLTNINNKRLLALIGKTITVRAKTFGNENHNNSPLKAGLLLEKGKLYVNLWPFIEKENGTNSKQADEGIATTKKDSIVEIEFKEKESTNDQKESRTILFYEIPDDHTAVFNFEECTLTAITIPLKYRFRTNRNAVDARDPENPVDINIASEKFSSSINISLFGGYSWGKTKFTHRKKIGNRTKTNKNTIGLLLGSSAVTLETTNTNITTTQLQGDKEGTIGTVSFGLGYIKSWNKVSFGLFTGIDKGVGRVSNTWIYNGKPWLGIGLGYDLFKL